MFLLYYRASDSFNGFPCFTSALINPKAILSGQMTWQVSGLNCLSFTAKEKTGIGNVSQNIASPGEDGAQLGLSPFEPGKV
jgi:hypothetical protein